MDDDLNLTQEPELEPDGTEPEMPLDDQEPDASVQEPDAEPPVQDVRAVIRKLQSEKDKERSANEQLQTRIQLLEKLVTEKPAAAPVVEPKPQEDINTKMLADPFYSAARAVLIRQIDEGEITKELANIQWGSMQRQFTAEQRANDAYNAVENFRNVSEAKTIAGTQLKEALTVAQIEEGETQAVLSVLAELGIDPSNPDVSNIPTEVLAKLTAHARNSVRYLNSNNGSNKAPAAPMKPALNLMAPGAPATPNGGPEPKSIRELTEQLKRERGLI